MEEGSEVDEDKEVEPEEKVAQTNAPELDLQVLSLQSMVGLTTKRTLKIIGVIGDMEVVVLIDSGASCNFSGKKLVDQLGLAVETTQEFGVAIGDGQIIKRSGKCAGVKLDIQGVKIEDEYLLFELGNVDVVLGYSWLEKLGETRINWGLHIMRFRSKKMGDVVWGPCSAESSGLSQCNGEALQQEGRSNTVKAASVV